MNAFKCNAVQDVSIRKEEQKMDLIRDMRPFARGFHQLSVVATDLAEAESLIKALAEEEKKRSPDSFAGKEACVYYKLPYVPPCESFKELRRLILRIHESTGLRANYKGVIAIEASEWIGHEREEYFTVMLKYLYDHRSFWRIGMILNGCTPNQINRFVTECSRYITPRLFSVNVFGDRDTLFRLIQNECDRQGKRITQDGAELLAAALARPEIKNARSMTLIARAVEEILAVAENSKSVTADLVQDYLRDPFATPAMMAGRPLYDERSMTIEKEALQLSG